MECHASKWKLLALFLLTCLMVGASVFCTTLPNLRDQIVGWVGVGFFSLAFPAILRLLLRRGPHVVIDDAGIDDRRTPMGVIPWGEIRSTHIRKVSSSKVLCLEVADPDVYLERLPRWKRQLNRLNVALGYTPITIGFSGLSPGIDVVWGYLQEMRISKSATVPDIE